MKLIQILALATAMVTVAMAQSPSANSQTKASPTPTPAATGKTGGAAQPAVKKAASSAATKTSAGTPAKGTTDKTAPAKGTSTSGASTKPAVKTATVPVKATPAATQAKGTPTPVVAAKGASNTTPTKKTEAKKADTKKSSAAKTPAVIAVKPAQGTKKAGTKPAAAATKTPAKAPVAKVTPEGPVAQPTEKPRPTTARTFGAHGRRDPFVSPIVAKDGGINRPPSNCTSGKRCLVIPELVLQGTVKDTSGKMMAVVANSIKKTYFLRENDQVFQGSVEKITSDSIIFREYVKDSLGRETAREVVKKLVPAS